MVKEEKIFNRASHNLVIQNWTGQVKRCSGKMDGAGKGVIMVSGSFGSYRECSGFSIESLPTSWC